MEPRTLFLSLPVGDLPRARGFFAALGLSFDRRFTDARAACLQVSEHGLVMLVHEPFFRQHAAGGPEGGPAPGLVGLSCRSRDEVDQLFGAALRAGGRPAQAPVDRARLYQRSFHDPDGHCWSLVWTDPPAAPSGCPGNPRRTPWP